MTIALSNALAAAQTALLASQFAGGFIRLFDTLPPATPDRAEVGTLLGVISVDGLAGAGLHFTAAGATLSKADEPWVFKALASGAVKAFRLVAPGDTAGNDLSAKRIDGVVGTPDAPADMNFISTTVVAGASYTLDSFLYLIHPVGH